MTAAYNARQALMVQLLTDVDGLISRYESLNTTLGTTISTATKDGANQALAESRRNFERMMVERGETLLRNGRHAAAEVGIAMNNTTAEFIAAATALDRKALRLLLMMSGFALLAGLAGGGLMYWLLVM